MRALGGIIRRELRSYFVTPLAWVFAVIFLVLASTLTFYGGDFYARGQADLHPFFGFHPWLYLLLVPGLSMQMWAEERKRGTLELLLTLPVTTLQVVAGKFLATWILVAGVLLLTFPIWLTVNYLGDPDNGVILAAYLGSLLMAGAYIAIACCLSALSHSQIVAFLLTLTACFLLLAVGEPSVVDALADALPASAANAIAELGFLRHFAAISRGVLDFRDLFYFLISIALWLLAAVILLDAERGS